MVHASSEYSQIKEKLDSVTHEEKSKIVSFFIERITLHAKENYAEVVFKFPRHTEAPATKQVQTLSKEGGVSFPLVLSICTVSETERRRTILMANPGMYVPKVLV